MRLNEECKSCLLHSQLKKAKSLGGSAAGLELFEKKIREIIENAPDEYCSPILMRDFDKCHREIFGFGIDYSKEKKLFNSLLSGMEEELYKKVILSPDPIKSGLKFAMAANYIDFARLTVLDGKSVEYVLSVAENAEVDEKTLNSFKDGLKNSDALLYLLDNCGEIVLDKILIRAILKLYPKIKVTAVVRGAPIINDATEEDARDIGLDKICRIIGNGSSVAGTYLKEVSEEVLTLLSESGVILSKGLGNLETLYGEGYGIFYAFNCKCNHSAEQFALKLWTPAFIKEKAK